MNNVTSFVLGAVAGAAALAAVGYFASRNEYQDSLCYDFGDDDHSSADKQADSKAEPECDTEKTELADAEKNAEDTAQVSA